ncbi:MULTISPECIES: hypothetical protein [Kitasatospora]|uniref:Peptidase MA-like domain-containing protein n=1 Tax=Kitasatospora setae (strain ATCC 33774 / DSM 43861 / JCM 3304 / KCC A-0304 / NBRC 14216 / KM-6054) TaxID=452652 RepID=E4N9W5_KITSK|nr:MULTISPECIES: hypothetical protein [Kitasatospora]BAJ27996.1 hypothetical protein KSE_21740 [Kitasatospora setae KM-6054]
MREEVVRLLGQRARAVAGRDTAALLAVSATGAEEADRDLLTRTAALAFAGYELKLTVFAEPPADADRLSVGAELAYRLTGVDDYPALLERRIELVREPAGWRVAAETPTGAAAPWDLGTVRVAEGKRCLVLGLGEPAELAALVALADRAVPAAAGVWGPSDTRLLLELPLTVQQFARRMDVSADAYQGIAAVTLAVGGAPVHTPADRIVVNPDAYRQLSELGRRVVVTHEATHVATRADTRAWTPLWLSEGVADYTGYLGTGRTARQIAPELAKDVRAGRMPTALPADTAFAAGSDGIAQAYELSWLACDLIARTHGQDRLVALYRTVGAFGEGGLDRAMKAQLGVGVTEFTKSWTAEVAKLG